RPLLTDAGLVAEFARPPVQLPAFWRFSCLVTLEIGIKERRCGPRGGQGQQQQRQRPARPHHGNLLRATKTPLLWVSRGNSTRETQSRGGFAPQSLSASAGSPGRSPGPGPR